MNSRAPTQPGTPLVLGKLPSLAGLLVHQRRPSLPLHRAKLPTPGQSLLICTLLAAVTLWRPQVQARQLSPSCPRELQACDSCKQLKEMLKPETDARPPPPGSAGITLRSASTPSTQQRPPAAKAQAVPGSHPHCLPAPAGLSRLPPPGFRFQATAGISTIRNEPTWARSASQAHCSAASHPLPHSESSSPVL